MTKGAESTRVNIAKAAITPAKIEGHNTLRGPSKKATGPAVECPEAVRIDGTAMFSLAVLTVLTALTVFTAAFLVYIRSSASIKRLKSTV